MEWLQVCGWGQYRPSDTFHQGQSTIPVFSGLCSLLLTTGERREGEGRRGEEEIRRLEEMSRGGRRGGRTGKGGRGGEEERWRLGEEEMRRGGEEYRRRGRRGKRRGKEES